MSSTPPGQGTCPRVPLRDTICVTFIGEIEVVVYEGVVGGG
jgi:hypothetical protein